MKLVLSLLLLLGQVALSQGCAGQKPKDCKAPGSGCIWSQGSCLPAPTPAPVAVTPVPTPAPVVVTPNPTPAPVAMTPNPTPAPVAVTPNPTPAPVAVTPNPTPAPVSVTPNPTPAPQAPTGPAAPIDGTCVCGECNTGPLSGISCLDDAGCGGFCDDKTIGGPGVGGECTSPTSCPPNNGKKSDRGGCTEQPGWCQGVECPTRPTMSIFPTYKPGFYDLNTIVSDKYGRTVSLSDGLNGRAIAYTGEPVQLYDSSGCIDSSGGLAFHGAPDAGHAFAGPNDEWYYVSNAEVGSGGGGVYSIKFNADGDPIDYYNILSGTTRNCGGGDTPWGSWVSCEESGTNGICWQTDPSNTIMGRETNVVDVGGNYESFAYMYDPTNPMLSSPTFYTTNDSSNPLVRFTPNATGMACFNAATDEGKWCTLEHGTHDFLELIPEAGNPDQGTFQFGPKANANANTYPYAEGIDVIGNKLYFVSKTTKKLFILTFEDAVAGTGTFERSNTNSGAFNNQPDQLQYILNDENNIVYFCEDGGNDCGVHGRNATAHFFSILDGTGYNTETTGLAFSPDGYYMLLSFQFPGVIWQFWREDGHKFSDLVLDIKYHETTSP